MTKPFPQLPQFDQQSSLRERVKALLLAKIMGAELAPGQLYSVAQFSESLGISPTPIREAVLDLAQAGLVTVMKNRGFIIPDLGERELNELHHIRMLLEIPATVDACMAADAQLCDACEALAKLTVQTARNGSLVDYVEQDRKFHATLLTALNMPVLRNLIMTYRDRVRLRGLAMRLGSLDLIKSAEDHLRLIEAARARDAGKSLSIITQHIEATRERWKEIR